MFPDPITWEEPKADTAASTAEQETPAGEAATGDAGATSAGAGSGVGSGAGSGAASTETGRRLVVAETPSVAGEGYRTGKWLWEWHIVSCGNRASVGVCGHDVAAISAAGVPVQGAAAGGGGGEGGEAADRADLWLYRSDGNLSHGGESTEKNCPGGGFESGDVIGVELDADAGTLSFLKNDSYVGAQFEIVRRSDAPAKGEGEGEGGGGGCSSGDDSNGGGERNRGLYPCVSLRGSGDAAVLLGLKNGAATITYRSPPSDKKGGSGRRSPSPPPPPPIPAGDGPMSALSAAAEAMTGGGGAATGRGRDSPSAAAAEAPSATPEQAASASAGGAGAGGAAGAEPGAEQSSPSAAGSTEEAAAAAATGDTADDASTSSSSSSSSAAAPATPGTGAGTGSSGATPGAAAGDAAEGAAAPSSSDAAPPVPAPAPATLSPPAAAVSTALPAPSFHPAYFHGEFVRGLKHGPGVLRLSGKGGYWRGKWFQGVRHGVHLKVEPPAKKGQAEEDGSATAWVLDRGVKVGHRIWCSLDSTFLCLFFIRVFHPFLPILAGIDIFTGRTVCCRGEGGRGC